MRAVMFEGRKPLFKKLNLSVLDSIGEGEHGATKVTQLLLGQRICVHKECGGARERDKSGRQ